MNKLRLVFGFITLFLVAEVQAVEKSGLKQFGQVRPDKALVYLVRQSHFQGSIRTQFVYVDDQFATALDNGTYSYAYLDPGERLIWTNWTSVQNKINFVAGQVYYLDIFNKVRPVPKNQGELLVRSAKIKFAKSTSKEIAKSKTHIKKRYGRAVKKMKKVRYASLPAVDHSPALQPKKGAIPLIKGTTVSLKIMENITSSRVKTGQKVVFEVARSVVIKNHVLVQQGTSVEGIVHRVEHGKSGGVAGEIEVEISGVRAVDGNLIPVIGQISSQGEDRMDRATGNALMFGLVGLLSTKSREGFMLSQTLYSVPIKSDVYIVPQKNQLDAYTYRPERSQPVYTATIPKPIKFSPAKKTKVKTVKVELLAESKWDSLTLIAAHGIKLPSRVKAIEKKTSKGKQIFVFDGWDFVKYLPLGINTDRIDLIFEGMKGGTSYSVKAVSSIVLK